MSRRRVRFLVAVLLLPAVVAPSSRRSMAVSDSQVDGDTPFAIVPAARLSLSSADAVYGAAGVSGWWGRAGLGPVMGGLSVYGITDLRASQQTDTLGMSFFLRMALSRPKTTYMALEIGPAFEAGSARGGSQSLGWGGFLSPRFFVLTDGKGEAGIDVGLRLETMGRYDQRDFRIGLELSFPMGRGLNAVALVGDSAEQNVEWLSVHHGVAQVGTTGIQASEGFSLGPKSQTRTWQFSVEADKECLTAAAAVDDQAGDDLDVDLEILDPSQAVVASDRLKDGEPVASYCPTAGATPLTVRLLHVEGGTAKGWIRVAVRDREEVFGDTYEAGGKRWTAVMAGSVVLPYATEARSWEISRTEGEDGICWALAGVEAGTPLLVLGLPSAGLRTRIAPCGKTPDTSWMVGSGDKRAIVGDGLKTPDFGTEQEKSCLLLAASQATPFRVYVPAGTTDARAATH